MKKAIAFLVIAAIVMSVVAVGTVMAAKKVKCTTIQDGTITYGRVGDPSTDIIPIGYDQWGYNYQAHMFNGWYHNSPRPVPPYTKDTIYQAPSKTWLIMKWSDEWLSNKDCNRDGKLDRGYSCNPENPTSSACQGAWLTNHQWGSYLGNWDLTGTYTIVFSCTSGCSGDYPHTMTVDAMYLGTGVFSGTGNYITNLGYTWDVTGTVSGSDVSSHLVYTGLNPGYYVDLVGTIAQDGTMSGTATSSSSQTFDWHTTTGAATGETCKWNYFVKIVMVPEDAYKEDGMWYTADGEEIGSVIWTAYARIQQVYNDPCAGDHGIEYLSPTSPGFGYYN